MQKNLTCPDIWSKRKGTCALYPNSLMSAGHFNTGARQRRPGKCRQSWVQGSVNVNQSLQMVRLGSTKACSTSFTLQLRLSLWRWEGTAILLVDYSPSASYRRQDITSQTIERRQIDYPNFDAGKAHFMVCNKPVGRLVGRTVSKCHEDIFYVRLWVVFRSYQRLHNDQSINAIEISPRVIEASSS